MQVGVLRWMLPPMDSEFEDTTFLAPPRPAMTIVAKLTWSFAECRSPADAMVLAAEPEGMALDVPSELDGAVAEIAYPSDFVPLKPACDVLLHGHAHSEKSKTRLPAGFELGSLSRVFAVVSAMEAVRAPLVHGAMEERDAHTPADPVGPSPTPGLLDDYPEGFNFEAYQRAPVSQQLREAPLGETLTLYGLSAVARARSLRIPDVRLAAWIDTTDERGQAFPMACDTLWIDTDRDLLVVVYRGVMLVPSLDFDGVTQVTLALSEKDREPELSDVQRDLGRGAFEVAVELSDFEADAKPPLAAEEAAFAKYAVWESRNEPSISLETYALVSAELAESRAPRGETLERYGFDEGGFLLEERAWLTKMGEAAVNGDNQPATRYGELFVAAQDGLARPDEGKESIGEYVALKVDMEDAADPMKLLSDRKMTLADFLRMDRRWTRRALAERALELDIERRARAYRAGKEAGTEAGTEAGKEAGKEAGTEAGGEG